MGQFLDRDIGFMLLAEGDARQFLPALARLGNKIVYMGDETVSASRLPTIRTVLRRSPIGSKSKSEATGSCFGTCSRRDQERCSFRRSGSV